MFKIKENTKVLKVFLGIGLVGIISGIVLTAMGDMLGVWIAGFAAYAVWKDYRQLKRTG